MTETRLVGVFNANGGLLGELSYLKGKLAGTSHCALCDITHGLNPLGKRSWKAAAACLSAPISVVHLNEMDAATKTVMAGVAAPAIVALGEGAGRVLIDSASIESCKDAGSLVALIEERLQAI